LAGTFVIAAATLVTPLRPQTNDLYTQVELALLALTMASVAALPAYVTMRASVARVLELVPVAASREAIDLLGTRERRMSRLRRRLLAAVDGDLRGTKAAIDASRAFGFAFDESRSAALFSATRTDDGQTVLTVPLTDGHAIARFETARLSPGTSVYLGLALVALAVAGMLGWRTGRAFADDVSLAEREIEATGVADVLRGGRIRGDARFQSVAALMSA